MSTHKEQNIQPRIVAWDELAAANARIAELERIIADAQAAPDAVEAAYKAYMDVHMAVDVYAESFRGREHARLEAVKAALLAANLHSVARIAELEAALTPFADEADTHSDKMPDAMFIWDYEGPEGGRTNLRIGDLRRARVALQTKDKP